MNARRFIGSWALVVSLVVLGAPASTRAVDSDGDGVDDALDVCNNTPFGAAVDAQGRPLGDIDEDCDVDLEDYLLFQDGFTGPLTAPVGACCYPDGMCAVETEAECAGTWLSHTLSCDPHPCPPAEMVLVPAGEFEMGDPWSEGTADELPVHDVYVSSFYVDLFEVTNQQYADWLNWAWAAGDQVTVAGGVVYQAGTGTSHPYCDTHAYDADSCIHWDGASFTVTAGREDHPMVEVSWYGAAAYCNWRSITEGKPVCYDLSTWACDFGVAGYRLPTEAEWEKAAAWDPDQQRHFRFGEGSDGCGVVCLDGRRANYFDSGDPYDAGEWPETTPAGFYSGALHYKVDFDWPGDETSYQTQAAESWYGCYDMTGNAIEWCHDRYEASYYSSSPYDNPTGPASGTDRLLRGGSWFDDPFACRSADRNCLTAAGRELGVGFRCAAGMP